MKTLQKYPVAILISILLIAFSIVLGQVKHQEALAQIPLPQTNQSLSDADTERDYTEPYQEENVQPVTDAALAGVKGAMKAVSVSLSLGLSLLAIIPALLLLFVVIVICNVVDNTRYSRYYKRYGAMETPPYLFRPIIFWHGPGSHWFLRRQQHQHRHGDSGENKRSDFGDADLGGGFGNSRGGF